MFLRDKSSKNGVKHEEKVGETTGETNGPEPSSCVDSK